MSLVQIANVCSHLQNATRARLGFTSIPNTKQHLNLALALQSSGFVSTVVRGGPTPPEPHKLLSHPVNTDIEPVTPQNIATRRIWLGLKYWNSEPVLEKMSAVSKPTRRITMDVSGLRKLVLGQRVGMVEGLTKIGECMYVCTDKGILEARECVERKVGGMLLCRVR